MLIIIIIIIAIAILMIVMYFTFNNREVALRKEAEAQEGKITSVHDTMWKIIKEKAGVAEKYRETFEKISSASARRWSTPCRNAGLSVTKSRSTMLSSRRMPPMR